MQWTVLQERDPYFKEPETFIMRNKNVCPLLQKKDAIFTFQGYSLHKHPLEDTPEQKQTVPRHVEMWETHEELPLSRKFHIFYWKI